MSRASAPGKILWLGGYAVLERPSVALVTAVNARVHAEVKKSKEDWLDLPQFGIKKKINELSDAEREKAKFVLASISSVKSYLRSKNEDVSCVAVRTKSDDAFSVEGGKSGLGSSAAVTVATVAAMLNFFGRGGAEPHDLELVHKLSQYAHALAQEKVGSGFDIAAATYGTIKYVRYSPSLIDIKESDIARMIDKQWDYEIERVEWPSHFRIVVGNFIQESASTSAMVKQVFAFKKEHPDEYAELIKKIDEADRKAISALESGDYDAFAFHFNQSRLLTKKLGERSGAAIEPEKATRLIEKILSEGKALAAKLPGAGGGDSICAICIDEDSEKKTKSILQKEKGIKLLDVSVQNSGVLFSS